jgi:hypothetical protein
MFLLKRLMLILFEKSGEPVYDLALERDAVVREAVIRCEMFNGGLVSTFGCNRADECGGIGGKTIVCRESEQGNLSEASSGVFHAEGRGVVA